jgi:hypothetical protein
VSIALIIVQDALILACYKWRWMAEGIIFIELGQMALRFAIP